MLILAILLLHCHEGCGSSIVQETERCTGEIKGGTRSQSKEGIRSSGHLESPLPEISVLERLPLEAVWK